MPMSWAGTSLRKNDMRRVLAGALTALFGTSAAAPAPAAQTAPTISGLAASGNTLTATPGTYSGAQTVTGQWQRNGQPISGATSSTYTVQTSDGPNIAYLETATAPSGASMTQRALSQYLGQVATASRSNSYYSNINATAQAMSRSRHTAKETLTSPQFAFANFLSKSGATTPNGTGTEAGGGGAVPVTASVESIDGSTIFGQIKFSGSVTGSIPSGKILLSDALVLSTPIPAGTDFYVRAWHQTPYGAWGWGVQDTARGEGWKTSATTPDVTMTPGAITGGSTTQCWGPCAIVQPTIRPSVLIVGDSEAKGSLDVFDGSTTDLGLIARGVGANYGYLSNVTPGLSATQWATNHTNQVAYGQFASHVVVELGVNDFYNDAKTTAQAEAALQSVYAAFPSLIISQSTIAPVSSSTDNWATTANQTPYATNNVQANRIALNGYIRGRPAPLAQIHEVADVLETARDSGIYRANGAANGYTADGLHPSPGGYQLVRNSGLFTAATFAR